MFVCFVLVLFVYLFVVGCVWLLFGFGFFGGMGSVGRLFQSLSQFIAGFVLQGCSLLLMALRALGDSPVLLTAVDFVLVAASAFPLLFFSLALQTPNQGHKCPRTQQGFMPSASSDGDLP